MRVVIVKCVDSTPLEIGVAARARSYRDSADFAAAIKRSFLWGIILDSPPPTIDF